MPDVLVYYQVYMILLSLTVSIFSQLTCLNWALKYHNALLVVRFVGSVCDVQLSPPATGADLPVLRDAQWHLLRGHLLSGISGVDATEGATRGDEAGHQW